jgi:hypothetical protein
MVGLEWALTYIHREKLGVSLVEVVKEKPLFPGA